MTGGFRLTQTDGWTEEFDAAGLLTRTFDRNGLERLFSYTDADADGLQDELASYEDEVGRVKTFTYSAGRLSQMTVPGGSTYDFEYNADGTVKKITAPDPDGAGPAARPFVTFTYDATTLLPDSFTDAAGDTLEFTFGADRRFRGVSRDDGTSWSMTPLQVQGLTGLVDAATLGVVKTDSDGRSAAQTLDRFGFVRSSTRRRGQRHGLPPERERLGDGGPGAEPGRTPRIRR